MRLPACPPSIRTLALALAACGSLACSGAAPGPSTALDDILTCGARELAPCDVLEAACQQRIAEIAACQWGGPGTPVLLPPVSMLSGVEYRAQLDAQRERAPAADVGAPTLRAVDEVLALLGLTDRGELSIAATSQRSADVTLAFYDFESKSITLIDRGAQQDPVQADATLLHELIHAQQDAAYDLGRLQQQAQPSLDSLTALRGLFEGEAEFHERLFELGLRRVQERPERIEATLRRQREAAERAFRASPNSLTASMQGLPYTHGPVWMYELWLEGGASAVQERYAAPPSNLLELLQAAWDRHDEVGSILEYPTNNVFHRGPRPADDSELIPLGFDRLGPQGVYVAAGLSGGSAREELALGWRGDQLDVYELDSDGVAGRWQLRFESPALASTFAELMARNPDVTVRQQGAAVACVVSASGRRPEWLFGPLGVI